MKITKDITHRQYDWLQNLQANYVNKFSKVADIRTVYKKSNLLHIHQEQTEHVIFEKIPFITTRKK